MLFEVIQTVFDGDFGLAWGVIEQLFRQSIGKDISVFDDGKRERGIKSPGMINPAMEGNKRKADSSY